MLFWLTFIQTLPAINLDKQELVESSLGKNMRNQETIITQDIEPTFAQVNVSNLSSAVVFPVVIGGLVILLIIAVWAYTRVYVITPTNEAFVRTGGVINKNKKVILNGGCVILPGFHELTRVPLREISIDVIRQGALAVRTQDYLRANMRVTFYVCINAQEDDVLRAAARLSKQGKISESDIKEALEKRADDAIRAAAKKKKLAEIDSDKLGFADEVLNLIQQDLKKVGLTLNNIAISEIEENDTYDENNFFDAQGVKLRTETIQRSIKQKLDVELTTLQEKKELELNTKVKMEQQELDAEKQSLTINQQKEEAKLNQQKQVESLKAQREREIQETKDQEATKIERNKILQQKAVEEEKIQQQLLIQQSKIDADIALEERNKQFKIAKTLQEQEAEVAEINRQKTVNASNFKAEVEIAEAQRESKIAQEEAAIAIANKEKERLITEAQKAEAEERVATAQQIEIAEREKQLSLILADQEATKRKIGEENVIEIEVFRRKRQAEIAKQAAELEAEAIRTLADAKRYEAIAEAEGKQALIEAENALSDANRLADLIKDIAPELMPYLPEIMKAIAPQPGVLGDTKIYSFPGLNGNGDKGIGDINKLLLSTSGLSLINALMEEGKMGTVVEQVKNLFHSDKKVTSQDNQVITNSFPNPEIKEEIESF
jgi:uncharacterized membrane protein YqiK